MSKHYVVHIVEGEWISIGARKGSFIGMDRSSGGYPYATGDFTNVLGNGLSELKRWTNELHKMVEDDMKRNPVQKQVVFEIRLVNLGEVVYQTNVT